MTPAEPAARTAPTTGERVLYGWGRTGGRRCQVIEARDADDVLQVLASTSASLVGAIARGAGRSYGDAAQNAGGIVLDTNGLDRVLSIDYERRLVTAQAGASIAELMSALAPYGLTLPVVPGTRHVTLAGAIASDVHGKNHHRDGAFAKHVQTIWLCTPAQGQVEVSAEQDKDLFYATLGGMGLTGVIVQATLRAEPLASPLVTADIDRTGSLSETLEAMAGPERQRYSVAWLDLLASGPGFGRGVISRADPLAAEGPNDGAGREARDRRARGERPPGGRARGESAYPGILSKRPYLEVPERVPAGLLRPGGVRAFNASRWRAAPRRARGRKLSMVPYFFPLDAVSEWSRLYGRGGLIQYQLAIPAGQEAALERCFELIAKRRLPVYLAVFKRFGAASGGPLSFPIEGWTLAIDLPAMAGGLEVALDELDRLVAGCGGRVYLAKDSRLRPELLAAMYPELKRFEELRAEVDPDGVLRSDLGARLGLCLGSAMGAGASQGRTLAASGALSGAVSGAVADTSPRARTLGAVETAKTGTEAIAKRVLLLGGTSEIGLEIVRALAGRGPCAVALAGRDPLALKAAAERLRSEGCGRVSTLSLDALDTDSHEQIVAKAFGELGGVDVAILAVGVLGRREGLPSDASEALATLQTNLVGAGSLLIATAGHMREQGSGAIVVLSSVAAERPRRAGAVYGASKAGLD
ncbi:MAG TPA: SDR family NAD(P)-dependent oxidoreductase, partial [Solirubrobacteraceae bacterium]|nr:SDR family NAD(P)-dependent oxidoreductase [Solirubrobacteraceae bacterium]